MKSLPPERIVPTIGLNIAKITQSDSEFVFWDLGGQEKLRKIWNKYYEETDGIVYIIDGADESRFDEVRATLEKIMEEPTLQNLPHLILLNKSDLEEFKGAESITEKLKLYSLKCDDYVILPVSALKETGLAAAVNWIMESIKSKSTTKYKKLEDKV
uniref:Uncharacterized protein n=1 Tax=Euplotes harpa TaxID=151035 RepID=A0A7S3NER2_9SPIT|mmetsp:Transcript_38205/g.43821  ORF Transcript_38205/g.43821 Transcript_38205/m.43821 type:complete len:157 (+) Transcript_38205:138-608(+)